MLLSVPLTMVLKVALLNSEDFRWVAVAMSKEERTRIKERVEELKEAVQEADSQVSKTPAES